MQCNIKNKKAFTLIETLIGISILSIAMVAPMSLASRSLYAVLHAKNQIVASQLAQEGLEIIRQKRDSELIDILRSPGRERNSWLNIFGINNINDKRNVVVDVSDLSQIIDCASLNAQCAKIMQLDGFYRSYAFLTGPQRSQAQPTRFERLITIEYIDDGHIKVHSYVRFKTGTFGKKTIKLTEVLYNYLPQLK